VQLNKKLSKGKVSVVLGTQKGDSDHMISAKDIRRNEIDLEHRIDEILKELKEELKLELGISTEGQHHSKASQEKGFDHFLYESLSKSTQ
jgi:hypothetical protein